MGYLNPSLLASLRNLQLVAKTVVEGLQVGLHRSRFQGSSLEFSRHREYAPGDDLKRLDWKIYGRSDRFFVKQYEEERNLEAYLLLDASGSMGYRSRGAISKWQYSCFLAACLGYLLISQRDAVGLALLGPGPTTFLPPHTDQYHFHEMLKVLEKNSPQRGADLGLAFRELEGRVKKRALMILISDLLGDPEDFLAWVRALRGRRHECRIFQVLDPDERELPWEGNILVEDLEQGAQLRLGRGEWSQLYRRLLGEILDAYRWRLKGMGASYQLFLTAEPLETALGNYLARQ
ncbi:MAG: DUF58 domain-containing protein [Elusimicrobia bacterium]|nr:DUF58 domain-containing protein [Elusimicrobiota bacterium]